MAASEKASFGRIAMTITGGPGNGIGRFSVYTGQYDGNRVL
jgi:hypothetical protein